jgi:hypothetical protein
MLKSRLFPNLSERRAVVLLTLLGLTYRVLTYFLFSDKVFPNSDVIRNIRMGRRFAAGNLSGVLDIYWPPLYPILIGIVSYFIDDLLLPAVIVSILSGSLAVALVFYFVRQSYGFDAAVIAGVLSVFYPYLINSVFAIGTENIYLICILGALIAFSRGLENRKLLDFFLSGILLGCGYLTRPEAIGYIAFFLGFILINRLWERQLSGRKVVLRMAVLVLGFAIFAIPYASYLRSETGKWTVSGKMGKNFASGVFSEGEDLRSLTDAGDEVTEPVSKRSLISNFIFNLREAQAAIGTLIPMFLMALAGLGLLANKWPYVRLKREVFLVSFCLATVIGYAATWVLERYLYVLLPIFFGWVALGIISAVRWFRTSSPGWFSENRHWKLGSGAFLGLCVLIIYLYVFPANFYVRSRESDWQARSYEERDAGLWLKQNAKASPNLFSLSFKTAFYAGAVRFWTRSESMSDILKEVKECGGPTVSNSEGLMGPCQIDYVVSSERHNAKYPFLANFTEVLSQDPDFYKVYENDEHAGYEMTIFEYRPSKKQ